MGLNSRLLQEKFEDLMAKGCNLLGMASFRICVRVCFCNYGFLICEIFVVNIF